MIAEFKSVTNNDNLLALHVAEANGDVFFETRNDADDNFKPGTMVRLRLSGTFNAALSIVFHDIVKNGSCTAHQKQLFDDLDRAVDKGGREYKVPCDDNPGSGFSMFVNERVMGIQTYCFDAALNRAAGGHDPEGYGPIVWIDGNDIPDAFRAIQGLVANDEIRERPPLSV